MTANICTAATAQLMAGYNRWMNDSMYATAWTLDDEVRKADAGAFFSSIHGTLNHLVWADQTWMNRFAGTPAPRVTSIAESPNLFDDFARLRAERQAMDVLILQWAASIDDAWFAEDLTWFSGAAGREVTRPRGALVIHFFNHQTHHRGQVHALLTRAGVEAPPTDIFLLSG
ncbi:MAG: DinB family protein [Pseudomonadota bacterium]